MRLLILCLLLTLTASSAGSQTQPDLRLAGTIHDSATTRPIPRIVVCAFVTRHPRGGPTTLLPRCTHADTLGTFVLDSIPRDWEWLQVACRGPFGRSTTLVALHSPRDSFPASPWRPPLASGSCDLRPVRSLTGRFAGLYAGGFEESSFRRCDAPDQVIWMSMRQDAAAQLGHAFMSQPPDTVQGPVYITVWGTLTGPGAYGHMAVAEYELRVDSLYTLGRSPPQGCP